MKLTKFDIAFIAEQRTAGIKWKWLARIYNMDCKNLQSIYRRRINEGFKMNNHHVYPVNAGHILFGENCWCCPKIEYINGVRLIVHNSKDESH